MIAIMSPGFLDHLATLPSHRLHLARGELLFQRGDPVRWVYAVLSGEVHLLRRQADGAYSILQRAGPGGLIAEASLMSETFHCGAEAVEPSTLSAWSSKAVRKLIDESRDVALAYAAHLAGEVRVARQRAEIASLRRVCDRLEAWLTWHGGVLPEKGSWHHLAREINVTPEALYREIARRQNGDWTPARNSP